LPGAIISGFAPGDTIDLSGIANVGGSHADMDHTTNVLTITEGGQTFTVDFDPHQDFTGDTFQLVSDHNGAGPGTLVEEVACYCPGTMITTERGERLVENLGIGDRVMTVSGVARPIKWIGRRTYAGRFIMGRKDVLPVCIKARAIEDNVPRRDLWISPHHAMYLDGVLIEAKDLVNGVSIVQAERVDSVDYFHIELDSHDVIIAEGALSESFIDDDSRGMFHNAHEYDALYAGEGRRRARYCAPRLDHGYQVEAVRQRIALRAAPVGTANGAPPGELRGYIDVLGENEVAGWAQSSGHPEAAVCLDIYVDGRPIGQVLANSYREDLERAGVGSGCHSFRFTPPAGYAPLSGIVEVRRSLDGALLEPSSTAAGPTSAKERRRSARA
jgi:hypothetical protein